MDDTLSEKELQLKELLDQAAQLSVKVLSERQQATGTMPNSIPHYSQIEANAHKLGRQLGQAIQSVAADQVRLGQGDSAVCPGCETVCKVKPKSRPIRSVDGPTEITEASAYCRHCRRSFFPST